MPNDPECQTWSVNEAATILGVKPNHVYDLCKRDELPHLRLGGKIVVPKEALSKLIASAS